MAVRASKSQKQRDAFSALGKELVAAASMHGKSVSRRRCRDWLARLEEEAEQLADEADTPSPSKLTRRASSNGICFVTQLRECHP